MLPLLKGHVSDPDQDLRAKLTALQLELQDTRVQLAEERQKNRAIENSVSQIRRQLQPLHNALCALFGELESVSGGSTDSGTAVDSPKRKVWDSWIQKFGVSSLNGRMIAALLDHHSMTAPQLRVAMQCGNQSVYDTANRLNKLGLLEKNGNKYCLKEL